MNRRDFFTLLTSGSSFRAGHPAGLAGIEGRPRIAAGLEEHTGPLSRRQALHLLRRLTFGPTPELVAQVEGKTAAEAVELLLGPDYEPGSEPMPAAPGNWVDPEVENYENPENSDIVTRNQTISRWRNLHKELRRWWVNLMMAEALPAREKLTLFWSGHFTTEFEFDEVTMLPQLLYRQNQMLRRNRLGDMRTFVENVTLDGAMLVYLGGELNVGAEPNENYARELLELYTTGLGWYTEGDIQVISRILTGWKVGQFNDGTFRNGYYNAYFEPEDHDKAAKFLWGENFPAIDDDANTEFQVRRNEIQKLVNLIFRQEQEIDGVTRHGVAQFIGEKLYRYFVYSKPSATDQALLDQLQPVFKDNEYKLRPMIAALLKSAHFYEEANIGVQIKTPAEFMIGLARQLGATPQNVAEAMASVEQDLFDPPDVSGWDGYRFWITTKTYPLRAQFARNLINAMPDEDLVSFARTFPDHTDPELLTAGLEEYFLPKPVTQARHGNYVAALLQNAQSYEWEGIINDNQSSAALRLRAVLEALSKAPDFHLC